MTRLSKTLKKFNASDWIIITLIVAALFSALLPDVGLIAKFRKEDAEYRRLKIDTFQYKGHDMLRFEQRGDVSVCHSPECRKCIAVFD